MTHKHFLSFKIPLLKPAKLIFRSKASSVSVEDIPIISNMDGNQSYVPNTPNNNSGPSPAPINPVQLVIDPQKLLGFVPKYDGDPFTIYNYLNNARQWLNTVGGDTPQNVMLLLTKLEGRAAIIISMINHNFNWNIIETTLKSECADNREFNTLLVELSNVKKKTTYKDLIFELKQKLFFIKSKLADKYGYAKQDLVEEVMEPYINTAQNTLRNSLPYHDQVYVSNCNFNDTVAKILQLEAEGRFDNIKQKFSNILPAPRIINQPMFPVRSMHFQPTYSTQQRLFQNNVPNRPNMPKQNVPYHIKNPWSPNPYNNVFNRPVHPAFQRQQQPQQQPQQQRPQPAKVFSNDVSMRTVPSLKPNQINLGKGKYAEELFYHPESEEESFPPQEYAEFAPEYQDYEYYNEISQNDENVIINENKNFQESSNQNDPS